MTDSSFEDWQNLYKKRVEDALGKCLTQKKTDLLKQAMAYSVLGSGKRIRALLVFATGQLVLANENDLEQVACAIELIHSYSLIHDDLPCMDNDEYRRGKLACHVAFSESMALLAADALQALAFEVLAKPLKKVFPKKQLLMIRSLACAIGAKGMAMGQALDLKHKTSLTLRGLQTIHELKTGKLISAAILLGILCGRSLEGFQQKALNHFSAHFGLLFQMIDDILDHSKDELTTKIDRSCSASIDPTHSKILSLSEARKATEVLYKKTLKSLDALGQSSQLLRSLTHYIMSRLS